MYTYISPEDTHQGALKLSAYGNFASCHQAHFRVTRVGLGMRLLQQSESERRNYCREVLFAGIYFSGVCGGSESVKGMGRVWKVCM